MYHWFRREQHTHRLCSFTVSSRVRTPCLEVSVTTWRHPNPAFFACRMPILHCACGVHAKSVELENPDTKYPMTP
ncbi:hypothetical protein BDR03DRAFT_940578 [Suillus americanus]|nr:hypothetical protein BDR03DRAFT_940578 [Suillus americanus]